MIFGVRRWPVAATLVVLAAAALMVKLGFWQLQRAEWKEGLLSRYAAAADRDDPVAFPQGSRAAAEAVYYRLSAVDCASTQGGWRSVAGRNARDQTGYVHIIACSAARGSAMAGQRVFVQAGWTPGPTPPTWTGGRVTGRIAPYSDGFAKLVADPSLGGLAANATPNPGAMPNNHLAYAVQWFIFALTALVIYVLALRRRER